MIIGIFLLYIQMYNIWDNDATSKLRIEIFSDCESCNAGSLGQENPLEEGMATRSSNLAWRIPWTEEPGGLQSRGLQRARHDWATIRLWKALY